MKAFLKRLLIFVTFPVWVPLFFVYMILSLFGIVWVFTGKDFIAAGAVLETIGERVAEWSKS